MDVGAVDDLLDAAAPVLTTTPTRSRCSGVIAAKSIRVGDGLLAGGHREMDEAAHPPGHLGSM